MHINCCTFTTTEVAFRRTDMSMLGSMFPTGDTSTMKVSL